MQQLVDAHAARWPMEQWPAYSPDVPPIEHRWQTVQKEAPHRKYCPACTPWHGAGDRALLQGTPTPSELTVLMARYCDKLNGMAAERRTKHFRKVYSSSRAHSCRDTGQDCRI